MSAGHTNFIVKVSLSTPNQASRQSMKLKLVELERLKQSWQPVSHGFGSTEACLERAVDGFGAGALHQRVPPGVRERMVAFLSEVRAASSTGSGGAPGAAGRPDGKVGAVRLSGAGGPWEFNLRDMLRWCELAGGAAARPGCGPGPACTGLPGACGAG